MTKNSEVKIVLGQYKKYIVMIRDLDRQIDDAHDRMISVKSASNVSGIPRGGHAVTVDDLIADVDDLERRKDRFQKIADQKKEIVQSYIDTVLSPRHNRVLTRHFIKCQSINEICKLETYSRRHVLRLYHEALDMVDLSLDL